MSIWYTPPEAVEKVHRDFLAVGADVIETDTLALHRLCWREYDRRSGVQFE